MKPFPLDRPPRLGYPMHDPMRFWIWAVVMVAALVAFFRTL